MERIARTEESMAASRKLSELLKRETHLEFDPEYVSSRGVTWYNWSHDMVEPESAFFQANGIAFFRHYPDAHPIEIGRWDLEPEAVVRRIARYSHADRPPTAQFCRPCGGFGFGSYDCPDCGA